MTLIAQFEIYGLPEMTNTLAYKHWTGRYKEAKKWKRLVIEQCLINRITGIRLEKAKLTLTRHSMKEPDFDGLTSGFKHIIDGLVRAGTLEDDSRTVIGQPEYFWEKAPRGNGRVTIKIEDPLDLSFPELKEFQNRHGASI